MPHTHRQLREAFHLLFLERLLRRTDPRLYVLKGGTNLRFFFGSPRYSEDMDIDVLGGSVATLKKNGYGVLDDRGFRRSLAALGVVDVDVNDPDRAKHTSTTQRFRARLVTAAGESWPTKVEFSRRRVFGRRRTGNKPAQARGSSGAGGPPILVDSISPAVAGAYRQLAFRCQHYSGEAAAAQKLSALVNRSEPQVRDAFDLYVLWLGGHWDRGDAAALTVDERVRALDTVFAFSAADYASQVVDYLETDVHEQFAGAQRWNDICATLLDLLDPEAP